MKYTLTHEWIEVVDGIGTVGVTDHAQKELGEIVYVELPQVGKEVKAGQEIVVLESTKAAADVYSPVAGKVIAVNSSLGYSPELVNQSPEKEGWICKIELFELKQAEALLDYTDYISKFS